MSILQENMIFLHGVIYYSYNSSIFAAILNFIMIVTRDILLYLFLLLSMYSNFKDSNKGYGTDQTEL